MAKGKKKQMTPKEVERIKDELRQLKLIRSYSKYRLPEDQKLRRIERATELILADDSRMDDVVLLDIAGLTTERTKVLEMHKEVLSKDRIEAVTGLEKKHVKELLARGLTMESIEQLSMQVVADSGELEPEAIKDAIVVEAVEQGAIEPLPEDESLGIEVDVADPEGEEELEFATLPGMEIVALDDETELTAADDEESLARIQDQTGIVVEEDPETGDVVVTTLEERMEITPEGGIFEAVYIEALERELTDRVAVYKKYGNVTELEQQLRADLEAKLAGTEIVMDEDEKGELVLRAITRQEREEQEAQIDEEKRKIAEALGIDPAEILSIIRLKSVAAASEMTNMHLYNTNDNIVVRLRNNNFKMLREVGEGTSPVEQRIDTQDGIKSYMEIQDYEINPLMNEVAPALKDTAHRGYTDLLAGEVEAGKTRSENEVYNIVKIRRAGEAKMDSNDYLVYIGLTGDNRIADVVTNHGSGLDFDRDGIEITYPRDVCIQGKEYGIHDRETAEKERETPSIELNSALDYRIALLEELLEIEELIKAIEQNTHSESSIDEGQSIVGNGSKDKDASREAQLDEAYSRRGEILIKLGYSENDLMAAREEAERAAEEVKSIGPRGSIWS